jgi:hypothetical protein
MHEFPREAVNKELLSRLLVTSDPLITRLKSVLHQPNSFLLGGLLDCNLDTHNTNLRLRKRSGIS